MGTFVCALLLIFPPTKHVKDAERLREFMRDAVEQKLSNTEIEIKYFCPSLVNRNDERGEKARKKLEQVLALQRPYLREAHIAVDEVVFTPYDGLPASQIPPKPFHMLGETTHVYVAQYRGKIITYFLLQDDKIASTLLIGQGHEHYFVDFCH